MSEPTDPDQAAIARIRRHRNLALGLLLAGFVVLVYFISIAKLG